MLTVIKFIKILCVFLLAVSVIVTTLWISEAYLPGGEDTFVTTTHLQWVSWYFTAPLIVIYFLLKMIRRKMKDTN